jgi:hypothetical protein
MTDWNPTAWPAIEKGDVEGHEFHGNQYTNGLSHEELMAEHERILHDPRRKQDFSNPIAMRQLHNWQEREIAGLRDKLEKAALQLPTDAKTYVGQYIERSKELEAQSKDLYESGDLLHAQFKQEQALSHLHTGISEVGRYKDKGISIPGHSRY